MQTVFDNMTDGVLLIDKDLHWKFVNRQFSDFLYLPPEVAHPARIVRSKILRFQAERGDFGAIPDGDIEREVERRVRMMRSGIRYERRTDDRRFIEFNFKPLQGRLGSCDLPRHHRAEAA